MSAGLAAVLFLSAGCDERSVAWSDADLMDAESVDLLFHNGQILIVDDAFSALGIGMADICQRRRRTEDRYAQRPSIFQVKR